MTPNEYWRECVEIAADECAAELSAEQLAYISDAISGAHENYGMAFYSPPSTDRIHAVEREGKSKLAALQAEFEAYKIGAEKAIKRALHQWPDANVSIDKNGEVTRWGGRIERIL